METNQDVQTMVNILKKVEFFKDLDPKVHEEIVKHITLEYFPKGHKIFNEGDTGTAMYIIKSGVVRIFHPAETPSLETEVAMFGDGDFFGEMALLAEQTRSASASAMEETQAFKLEKADLTKLLEENPAIAALVSGEFLRRFKSNVREEQAKY